MNRTYHVQLMLRVPKDRRDDIRIWMKSRYPETGAYNVQGVWAAWFFDKTLDGAKTIEDFLEGVTNGARDFLGVDVECTSEFFCYDAVPTESFKRTAKKEDATPPSEPLITVTITDFAYRHREVPVPAHCPRCNQDFSESHSLRLVEFDMADSKVSVESGAKPGTSELNWDNSRLSSSGNSSDHTIGVYCDACDYCFGTSKELAAGDELFDSEGEAE